ncbi:hypothetical protein EV644_10891 [Kribbella orskensis]|uniref:Uncharacterized protein n=1 Tax=Kribbella orskensis TaxID=2512216 RepID=A0ABY2BJV5_9ACTN|nr:MULTISPECIES: hypothetical protein [Kribbella]TCN38696.1 hypothetical protein EV642_10891 [Kribbella sp. VKM Ac-2500]TCO20877.1 hypothetical protein EV644_10891 [Kribbella orskensis]
MNDEPVDYETFQAEMRRLLSDLKGATPDVVQAEGERLRNLAEQVRDERGRERARFRAGQLPRLLAGPAKASSEQFQQAQVLFARAINGDGPAETRIPQLERTIEQIGALADEAPVREAGAIRRLNSPLVRLIDHLQSSAG